MNPYDPPPDDKRSKYQPPIIDIWGLFFAFTIIVTIPALVIYILSWFI